MDARVSQLKKDFQTKLSTTRNNVPNSSIELLTKEELTELETAWVQLIVWKQQNVNA